MPKNCNILKCFAALMTHLCGQPVGKRWSSWCLQIRCVFARNLIIIVARQILWGFRRKGGCSRNNNILHCNNRYLITLFNPDYPLTRKLRLTWHLKGRPTLRLDLTRWGGGQVEKVIGDISDSNTIQRIGQQSKTNEYEDNKITIY